VESVCIGPGCTVVIIVLAIASAEAENALADKRVHVVMARRVVHTRLRRALVDLRLAAGTCEPGRTLARVGTQSIDTCSTVLTRS